MIATLAGYDSITAAGILARMALALDDNDNPAAKQTLPNEFSVREKILNEVRATLGLSPDDNSTESIERVGTVLDDESDTLLGPLDLEKALIKLSRKGQLPSDLYDVDVTDNVRNLYGTKFSAEQELIESTVASPDQEQHFGEPDQEANPHLVSLFTKHFPDRFPYKSFTLLVMGQRAGKILVVNQSWRIYADRVNLAGVEDLIDVVRRFADVFGREIDVNGERGKFIVTREVSTSVPLMRNVELLPLIVSDGRGRQRETYPASEITCFSQIQPGAAAFVFLAVDLDRYKKALLIHGW